MKVNLEKRKMKSAPQFVYEKNRAVKKDLSASDKHVGAPLTKKHAKKLMSVQRGNGKPAAFLKKKLPTRAKVTRTKTTQ